MKREEFIEELKNIGLTQVDFARVTGYHQWYVYTIGRDGRNIPRHTINWLKILREHRERTLALNLFMIGEFECDHCNHITTFTRRS